MLPLLLGLYLAALLAVTLWVRRRRGPAAASGRGFYVADGRLSALVTACSLAATSVGGSSTVVTAALVHRHGLAGLWLDLAGALGFLLLGLFVAGRVRATAASSIAELAGLRYGPTVRRVTGAVVLVAELAWLALLGKATAALLRPALPSVGQPALVGATLAAVVGYTTLGGQYVVSYTDVVQLALMIAGLCAVAPLALWRQLAGAGLSWTSLDLRFPTSGSFGWSRVGGLLLLNGLPHLVGSDIYAKLLSARDGRAAALGALGAALLKALLAAAIVFVALAGKRLLPEVDQPATLLGAVVHRLLPPLVAAPLLLALAATMMSSADQVLLSAVTVSCHDLWPARPSLRRILPPLYGALAAALALTTPTVIDLMKVGYTLFSCGLALPLLLGLLRRAAAPSRGVTAAMIAGAAVGGGLHVARLAGAAPAGDPIYWGLLVNAALLALSTTISGRGRSSAASR